MDGAVKEGNLYEMYLGSCEQAAGVTIKSDNQQTIDNCSSYYYFDKTDEYGCLRCDFNHNGLIKNWGINKCKEFDVQNKKCSKCMNEYYLDGEICKLKNVIQNCDWYSEVNNNECERCKEGNYLQNAGTCAAINTLVDNCKQYFIDQQKCA